MAPVCVSAFNKISRKIQVVAMSFHLQVFFFFFAVAGSLSWLLSSSSWSGKHLHCEFYLNKVKS